MGYAAEKIQNLDDSVGKTRRKVLNQDPSQKTGKLRNITQPLGSAVTGAAGTASNVGHVVAKVAGALGATGLQKALEGSTKVKWHDTYGDNDLYVPGDPGYESNDPRKKLSKEDRWERSGRRLKDFQSQIGQLRGARVDVLNTFEIEMAFEPSAIENRAQSSVISRLMGNIRNLKDDKATADLGIVVQRMTLPNITLSDGQTVKTLLGDFPVNGLRLSPDQHVFTMEIVNLTRSMGEDVFYPWMREVSAPFWTYGTQPYTTATVTVDFTEHTNLKYVFLNCRPSNIQTIQPTQEAVPNLTRQIQFTFDWMYVQNGAVEWNPSENSVVKGLDTQAKEGVLDKISKIGNAVNFSASNILKI